MHKVSGAIALMTIFSTLLALGGCDRGGGEAVRTAAPAIPVILGEVTIRPVELVLEQVGTLAASQEVTLRSETEGRVVGIDFQEGRPVARGAVLVRLDNEKVQASIGNLQAQVEELNARLQFRQRAMERNRPLLAQELISPLEFDNFETAIVEVQAQIAAARAKLALEKVRLSDTVLRAPFDGVTGVRTLSIGDYLRIGDPVVMVIDLDPLEITFQVPERLKPKISLDQAVNLRVSPYPEREFVGRITFIAPQVEIATRTFQVKAQVDNRERLLKPGMFARVTVVTETFPEAVTVPWESVIQTERETYLYTVEAGVARKVPVRLGQVTADWAQLFDSALAPGAPVILEGKFAASDGIKVAPKTAAAPQARE
ncbi:MAG: efflux RND transporter periplasmic adaptor subunit [Desulfuromonadales bacterium]|nr:efflux RND transporter periplasmic adaptor subunit [Desulfuromonadales bacterium]